MIFKLPKKGEKVLYKKYFFEGFSAGVITTEVGKSDEHPSLLDLQDLKDKSKHSMSPMFAYPPTKKNLELAKKINKLRVEKEKLQYEINSFYSELDMFNTDPKMR